MALSVQDLTDIDELVANGSDPDITRSVFELLNLSPQQVQERVQMLLHLGDRYMVLALLREDGPIEDQTGEALIERRLQRFLFQNASLLDIDEYALDWYEEAMSNYQSIFKQLESRAALSLVSYRAYHHLAVITLLLGRSDHSLEYLANAQSSTLEGEHHAELAYLRGIVYVQKREKERALQAFTSALNRAPNVQKYRLAQERVLHIIF